MVGAFEGLAFYYGDGGVDILMKVAMVCAYKSLATRSIVESCDSRCL